MHATTSFVLLALALTLAATTVAGAQTGHLERWPYLLTYPVVQESLKLTDDQRQRMGELLEEAKRHRLTDEELARREAELLQPGQRQRLNEIRLRVLLTRGALGPDLIESLRLTGEQKQRLATVSEQNRWRIEELNKRLASERFRTPGDRDALKRRYYEAARKSALDLLTPDQRAVLSKKLGKDFPQAFEMAESF
jgi:hypothetical protein